MSTGRACPQFHPKESSSSARPSLKITPIINFNFNLVHPVEEEGGVEGLLRQPATMGGFGSKEHPAQIDQKFLDKITIIHFLNAKGRGQNPQSRKKAVKGVPPPPPRGLNGQDFSVKLAKKT